MKNNNKKINRTRTAKYEGGSSSSDNSDDDADEQDKKDTNQRSGSISTSKFKDSLFSNIKMLALATLGDATQIKIIAQKLRALKGNSKGLCL